MPIFSCASSSLSASAPAHPQLQADKQHKSLSMILHPFAVVVRHDGRTETLWSRHLTPVEPRDLDWQETFVDLRSYAGQSVTLILVTAPGMADNSVGDRAGWGLPWLMRGTVDRRFGK